MMNFSNSVLFSALEQFDLVDVSITLGGGYFYKIFDNIVFTLLCVFWFLLGSGVSEYSSANSRVFFMSLMLYTYVRKLLSEHLVAGANIYFYYTVALFGFTLVSNIMGLVPYSLTVTSYFVVTIFLSGTSFFGNLIIGIKAHS